jgi:hypothetical protein
MVSRPVALGARDGTATLYWPHDAAAFPVQTYRGAFSAFLNLANATDETVRAFVERFGPLDALLRAEERLSQSVERYRELARFVNAVLALRRDPTKLRALGTLRTVAATFDDWTERAWEVIPQQRGDNRAYTIAAIAGHGQMLLADVLEQNSGQSDRVRVQFEHAMRLATYAVNLWVAAGDVRPFLSVDVTGEAVVERWTGETWGVIGLMLSHRVRDTKAVPATTATCHWCHGLYHPKRVPTPGERPCCQSPACLREQGAAHTRESRARDAAGQPGSRPAR